MARFIQCPKTLKLIPAEDYTKHGRDAGYNILPSMEAFVSPIDRKVLTDRVHLREHNKRHGVTNTADYGPDWFTRNHKERSARLTGQTKQDKKHRIESIRRAMTQHNQ